MTMVYPSSNMSTCTLCECRIRSTRHLCYYMVGARGAISYLLCGPCGKQARTGLPDEQLRKLDAKLECGAELHGLTKMH